MTKVSCTMKAVLGGKHTSKPLPALDAQWIEGFLATQSLSEIAKLRAIAEIIFDMPKPPRREPRRQRPRDRPKRG